MRDQGSYVPPHYVPLGQSDTDVEATPDREVAVSGSTGEEPKQWSSGICACFDDFPSCVVGLLCPCYVFGKNAEILGSGTFAGSCLTHFILWGFVNAVCCLATDGVVLGLPGCFVSCYACGYRRSLRAKYNLQEAPCGDFVTHFFCHLCALCQEYREIRERASDPNPHGTTTSIVTAPSIQTMESTSSEPAK